MGQYDVQRTPLDRRQVLQWQSAMGMGFWVSSPLGERAVSVCAMAPQRQVVVRMAGIVFLLGLLKRFF